MKAVGYRKPLPIDNTESLLDIELATPEAKGRDLLVEVKAISVNPVDTKLRKTKAPDNEEYKVLGYDAAGVVKKTGSECKLFKEGDEVFYAGSIARQGTYAQFHLVDERIVGTKPKSLNFAQSAALPLTSITAWELLFDRFSVRPGKPHDAGTLLIVGGAGGVGSILIQLARRLTGLTVIATASRPETKEWCAFLGAHYVIDHTIKFREEFKRIGVTEAQYIASLTGTNEHYVNLIEVLAPQGKFGVIDGPPTLDAMLLKPKCASLHWEYMFARSFYGTADILAQHLLLNEIADLVDAGLIRTTANETFGTINATNLKRLTPQLSQVKPRAKWFWKAFRIRTELAIVPLDT